MHLFLAAEDSEAELRAELKESFGETALLTGPGLCEVRLALEERRKLPYLAFARQWLPNARRVEAESIRVWVGEVLAAIAGVFLDEQPWSLHIVPHYGHRQTHRIGARAWHSARRLGRQGRNRRHAGGGERRPFEALGAEGSAVQEADAGRHRCRLIREELIGLLQKKRRHLLRHLRSEPASFTPSDSLVQVWLTAPGAGLVSAALAPLPFEQQHLLCSFPKGEVPLASDPEAPSRAFAKLAEAERRLGRAIQPGETCADLGAAPGSWTYFAARRGARVIAIDRSPLRADLMANRQVQFQSGDAFRFRPTHALDWLLCDVLADPERTAALLLEWLRRGWCRHFVATLKLKDASGKQALARLKEELPPLTRELFLTRLCANKKEVCAFGSV